MIPETSTLRCRVQDGAVWVELDRLQLWLMAAACLSRDETDERTADVLDAVVSELERCRPT